MQKPLAPNKKKQTYPFWAPRFWHSMRCRNWYHLLQKNGFRVHPFRWVLATTVSSLACFNSAMSRINERSYGEKIKEAKLPDDPLFIVGHWRSGTTYLHELLSCDQRFCTPTSYQCFAANHFLVTEKWLPRIFWFMIPSKRPMDNVPTGWQSPQEDEFALCALGAPSPYFRIAFPNEPENQLQYLDIESLPADDVALWRSKFEYFLKSLTLVTDRRLVLKSPTHTARIHMLASMFPNAKFLHIVRHPLAVFPSTINLWRVLDEAQGLQVPNHQQLKSYVLEGFEKMYGAFESQRSQLPADVVHDIRYEDLVQDPIGTLQGSYEALQLGDFENIRPGLEKMTQEKRSYRTNDYSLPDDVQSEVMQRWSEFAERYGYSAKPEDARPT